MRGRITILAGLLAVVSPLPLPGQEVSLRLDLVVQDEDPRHPDIRLVTPSDGYLLLLHVASGSVRVMFPRKPGSSSALASGEYNLERLNAEFRLSRRFGIIVAAWSETPIRTDEFVRYGHWATSDLSQREFSADPTAATIALATRLGAVSGLAASVEYGGVGYGDLQESYDTVYVTTYQGQRGDSLVWRVHSQLGGIGHECPVGSRDVTGAGESCSMPSGRPRSSPRVTRNPEEPYVPPNPPRAPAVTDNGTRSPPAPAARPATPPPAEPRPGKRPL